MEGAPVYRSNRERCTDCAHGEMWTPEFHRLGADCKHPDAGAWPYMERWSDGTLSIRPDAPPCPRFVPRADDHMRQLDLING